LLAKPKARQKPKAAHKLLFSLSFLSPNLKHCNKLPSTWLPRKTSTTSTIRPYNNNKLPSHDNNFFPETKNKNQRKTKGWREEKFHELIMKKKKKKKKKKPQ